MAKIFVAIAAYRDPDCSNTILDLFEKAKYPQNIQVGLYWQADPKADASYIEPLSQYQDQITIKSIAYQESKGVCAARSECFKLWKNEEYILQIDSHMRFVKNWDEILIKMYLDLEKQEHEKIIISFYAQDYAFIEENDPLSYLTCQYLENAWRLKAIHFSPYYINSLPCVSPFISGHFIFTKAKAFVDVAYDPYLYFMGEEIDLSVRFWTHGYNIFNPKTTILYHVYKKADQDLADGALQKQSPERQQRDYLAKQRINYLLCSQDEVSDMALQAIDQYGLGSERSLHEYQLLTGASFRQKTVSDLGQKGLYSKAWNDISCLKSPVFGQEEPPLIDAASIDRLQGLLLKFDINGIVDIGFFCANGFRQPELSKSSYIGIGNVEKNVVQQRIRSREHKQVFLNLDPARDVLPKADLCILTPEVLAWPFNTVQRLFVNLRHAQYLYLLAPIELTQQMIHLPEPLLTIRLSETVQMGLWDNSALLLYADPVSEEWAVTRKRFLNDFEMLVRELKQCFAENQDVCRQFFFALQQDWAKFNETVALPEVEYYLKKYWQYGNKDNAFRLNYETEFELLDTRFSYLQKDMFIFACILARRILSTVVDQLSPAV